MTKIEYMSELEGLLLDISLEEREEALTYYNDYFEDAGPNNVDDVINELGSPQNVAEIIKSDLKYTDPYINGEKLYTETGYKDTSVPEDRFEIAKDGEIAEKEKESEQPKDSTQSDRTDTFYDSDKGNTQNAYNKNSSTDWKFEKKAKTHKSDTAKIILIILLCIFAIPVGIPVLSVLFSLAVVVVSLLFTLFLTFGILAVVFVILGLVLVCVGIYQMFVLPVEGLFIFGSGLVISGFGLIFTIIEIWICKKAIPATFRGIVNFCRMPFRKREVVR